LGPYKGGPNCIHNTKLIFFDWFSKDDHLKQNALEQNAIQIEDVIHLDYLQRMTVSELRHVTIGFGLARRALHVGFIVILTSDIILKEDFIVTLSLRTKLSK
jgi:hypothetical protein